MAVIGQDGTLLREVPCPVPAAQRHRLRVPAARRACPSLPPAQLSCSGASQRGQIMVATQRIQVGMTHARKIVTVTASDHSFRLDIDGQTVEPSPGPPAQTSTVTRPTRHSHVYRPSMDIDWNAELVDQLEWHWQHQLGPGWTG